MPQFAYEARDEEGQLVGGLVAADSLDDAGRLLSARHLFVIRMAQDKSHRASTATVRGHATRAEVAWNMSQLSVMIETGIRLGDALEYLARQATRPQLQQLLEQISTHVQEGRSLSEAMQMFPKAFPTSLTAMIRASEMSGTMSQVLQRCSAYLVAELQILKRIRTALMYPAFMFVICLAVTVFLLTVILPRFADIFADRGAMLPWPTQLLLALSGSMSSQWYLWLGGAVIVVLAVATWLRTPWGRRQLDYLTLCLPLSSPVFNSLYQSRAFRAFSVLLEAGVPLIDAVNIVQQITPNTYYRQLWRDVNDRIERGEHIAEPLLTSPWISESVAQMIHSGDRSGKLVLVFSRLADFIEDEYNQAVKTATQFIEPCMIICMGSIIGFVAASLMLPLFQASQIAAG